MTTLRLNFKLNALALMATLSLPIWPQSRHVGYPGCYSALAYRQVTIRGTHFVLLGVYMCIRSWGTMPYLSLSRKTLFASQFGHAAFHSSRKSPAHNAPGLLWRQVRLEQNKRASRWAGLWLERKHKKKKSPTISSQYKGNEAWHDDVESVVRCVLGG